MLAVAEVVVDIQTLVFLVVLVEALAQVLVLLVEMVDQHPQILGLVVEEVLLQVLAAQEVRVL